MMKSKISLIASLLLACLLFAQLNPEPFSLRRVCSTEKSRWQELAVPNVAAPVAGAIKLDPASTFQTIDGFSGCARSIHEHSTLH